MKTKILLSIFYIAIISGFSFSQDTNALVDTYVENSESDLASLERMSATFAEQLRRFPTATGTVIFYTDVGDKNVNYCSKDKLTAARRADFVREILIDREHIQADRISYIDGYLRRSTELEFWIVRKGTLGPTATPNAHIHCVCANIEIHGPARATVDDRILRFSAGVSGGSGDIVTYRWQVSAGKIISGQGTPTIRVSLTNSRIKKVTATIDVKGASGCCEYCNESASLSTRVFR